MLGWILDSVFLVLFLASTGLLVFHLYSLYRLERWLREGNPNQPPDIWGVWGSVYYYVYRLQKRYMARKKKLAAIVKQFNQSAKAMPDGAIILGPHFEMIWFNSSARLLFGLKSPQDVGQRLVNLVRDPVFHRYIMGECYSEPIEMASPIDVGLILSLKICPYGDQQLLLLVRDVTQLKQYEIVRRDFISNISHELRTPLTVLKGCVEALEMGNAIPKKWTRSLALISEQTDRMGGLVNDLLLLSRVESAPRPESHPPLDMPGLIRNVLDELDYYGEQQQTFVIEIDQSVWMKGNESELYSVVSNLVTNAINYSPIGSPVTVRWYQKAEGLYLEVQDEGEGLLPEDVPRITERFFRVDVARSRKTGGTGLGLAILKNVLDLYQGELQVESQIGEGSLFRCYFPVTLRELPDPT